ncbi:probable insulin-like peptide 3 [Drosophila innubila]|uniref:probable insulin-like peptide 3 n=1 Tax=Drosophila innubila TaxID=198719 RepID=UPI00148CDF3B|nr:probable insulin-like peptide 3 [Drosophila innubila]
MQFESCKFILLAFSLAFIVYQVESLRLCGNDLPEALAKICVAGYNTKMKRTVPREYNGIDTIESNDNALGYYGAYSDLDFNSQPLLRALLGESAHQLLSTRRRRLGISDECCLKSCSWNELSMYCNNEPVQ